MSLAIEPAWVPKGYAVSTPAAAETLASPDTGTGHVAALAAGANTMVITPSGAGIFFTTDGSTTPSATAGGYIPTDVTRAFVNARDIITNFKMVQTAATATTHIEWYAAPGG